MNKYSETFRTRESDFDTNGNIKPSSVLDIFQEIAGIHANLLGVGFGDLIKNDLLWVITKVKFEIIKSPEAHKPIVAKTWPLAPSRVSLQREYLIEDENGNALIKGTSEWVTMNLQTRKLVISNDIYPLDVFCEDKCFEERTRKIPDFEIQNDAKIIIPEFCDLDRNCHVNNIKYADYSMNMLCPKTEVKAFQIDFHREIQKGMPISLYMQQNENSVLFKGISESGEKMFSCSAILK
jgi:acyl-ACP thioesterase